MPCRAATVCRQAPQCLWITDDILAEAFDRFARVSNTHRRRAEGRRYGSNVPGPLEAHRRSAKRRMGVAAVASSMPSPGIDLGALFGLGGFTPERKIDDWKWQPPGVKETPKPTRWNLGVGQRARKDRWETFLEVPEESSPEVRTQKSKQAFEEMLLRLKGNDQPRSEDTKDLFDFLQTAENEPEACNTLRLAEWLIARNSMDANFSAFYELLLGKVRLQTLGHGELTSIMSLLLKDTNAARHVAEMAHLLDTLPTGGALAYTCAALTRMLQADMTEPASFPRLQVWSQVVRAAQRLQGDRPQAVPWRGVYDILARRFPDFTSLKDHFSTMKRMELCRVLLRHWVPVMSINGQEDGKEMTVTAVDGSKCLMRQKEHRPHVDKLVEDFESLAARCMTRREKASGFGSVPQLIAVLHHHRVPYLELCNGLFDVLLQSASTGGVYRVFYGITHHAGIGIDNELAQRLIRFFIDKSQPNLAEKVFHAVPSLPLSTCYELPIFIARDRRCRATRLWTILQRLTPEDSVPSGQRNHPRNRLTPEHVDLIHLVAFYISRSQHMNPRSAFRRIWECYLFLRDRKAPVKPMLTRALVTAAVVRPLEASQGVSKIQFHYVLMLVARVEGRGAAEYLDRVAGEIWNKHVYPRVRERKAITDLQHFSSSSTEEQAKANATRTRLLTATKRFRTERVWLDPEKVKRRWNAFDYEPFAGPLDAENIYAASYREAVAEETGGYTPFQLAEDTSFPNLRDGAQQIPLSEDKPSHPPTVPEPNEAGEEPDALETPQRPVVLRDFPSDRGSASLTGPPADVPRSGLGYVNLPHSVIQDAVESPATSQARSVSEESADPTSRVTVYKPITSTASSEQDLSNNGSTVSLLGASQDFPAQTSQVGSKLRILHHAASPTDKRRGTLRPPTSEEVLSDPSMYWKARNVTPAETWRLKLHATSFIWRRVPLDSRAIRGEGLNTKQPNPTSTRRPGSSGGRQPSAGINEAEAASSVAALAGRKTKSRQVPRLAAEEGRSPADSSTPFEEASTSPNVVTESTLTSIVESQCQQSTTRSADNEPRYR
ncbi:hypothetical protein M409DRAFT_51579 [Zasmidium cellare ATCC 36951]|uniref:Uncharacterized protein n=1 Tax=Zasmidium cellare ATCC 36951 TaxID=1080233 RepID=A0A6A6CYV6_ZASCE|nr:uncharacterized protein M409DRAFT_51579 [Zasmidium cellare ATCC 36951]KAF2170556.1 hypothetical protein M409DRAFT_51579 [Zasmidium cellare ATCC 36951]